MIKPKHSFLVATLIGLATAGNAAASRSHHKVRRHPHIRVVNHIPTEIQIHTGDIEAARNTCPDELLSFAQSLIGTPYHFASANPSYGFDCSGFVGYVFKNFNIQVPRSSSEYPAYGEQISLQDARPGDVILFTGTAKRSRRIGHVGIVVCNEGDELRFIHSTSGKEHGVTITVMDKNYHRRFVRIVRLLKQNDAVLPDNSYIARQ